MVSLQRTFWRQGEAVIVDDMKGLADDVVSGVAGPTALVGDLARVSAIPVRIPRIMSRARSQEQYHAEVEASGFAFEGCLSAAAGGFLSFRVRNREHG